MQKNILTKEYKGYVNGPEITSLDPMYLISGSKNVLFDNGMRSYTSRTGLQLMGSIADKSLGIKGRFQWETSKKLYHIGRTYDKYWEVWFNNTWTALKSDLSSAYCEFAPVYSSTEAEDIMCMVNGEDKVYNWSGGAALAVAQGAGGVTLKMQGSYTATTIAFIDNGALPDTITDSANGFLTAGFASGDEISISGSASNNRNFTIGTVTAGEITLVPNDSVVTTGAGASILIHNGFSSWKERGFLASGTREILINGTTYTYTGGEATDTLLGVSALPAITSGQIVLQAVRSNTNAAPFPTGYNNDYIGVQRNQLYIGSKTSRLVYGSKTNDFTSFTYTANRLPGEGVELNLDTFCTGFEGTSEEITIFGGSDDIYTVKFQQSSDNTKEAVNIEKKDTSPGQGLISPHAKTRIKNNGLAFITKEPTLDTLGNVENMPSATNVPVSDLIKTNFDLYDFRDCDITYWKRNIIIALPAESLLLLYDLRYHVWQPPQEFAVSIGALGIDELGNLIGHSYVSNESYVIFSGDRLGDEVGEVVSDIFNGFSVESIARHYSNDGVPDQQKRFDQYHIEGYISSGIAMEHRLYFETNGVRGQLTKAITALVDRFLFGQSDIHWLGKNPLGYAPIGGGGILSAPLLFRFRKNHTYREIPYYEYISEFYKNDATDQFTICVHGPNAKLTEEEDPDISD
jgi:hypothetical protein